MTDSRWLQPTWFIDSDSQAVARYEIRAVRHAGIGDGVRDEAFHGG